jgi:hypothetical protein
MSEPSWTLHDEKLDIVDSLFILGVRLFSPFDNLSSPFTCCALSFQGISIRA